MAVYIEDKQLAKLNSLNKDLADYSSLYFGRIPYSYMVAILTGPVSQANCAALQTNRLSPKGSWTGCSAFMDGFANPYFR
jgi:hypothetical protein